MTDIRTDVSLRPYNTFGLEARARQFVEITSAAQLRELLPWPAGPVFILGGGSNLLLTRDVEALVLKNAIPGRTIVAEDGAGVLVAAGGGENWHAFVGWTLEQGLGGLENLSLIPGTVGAAPIQNIGAYGVELQDVFERLEAVELATGDLRTFDRAACRFGYRDSVFKGELRGQYVITRVFLRLQRPATHTLNLSYGAIRETLAAMGVTDPTAADVSRAVIRIRSEKLPDPARLGNAGSFFKNPVISTAHLERLRARYPDIVFFPAGEGEVKVPAGWLIERCGWKGARRGDAGCYERQALVLVNYGRATGAEILALAREITASVAEAFGIVLEPEVNVL